MLKFGSSTWCSDLENEINCRFFVERPVEIRSSDLVKLSDLVFDLFGNDRVLPSSHNCPENISDGINSPILLSNCSGFFYVEQEVPVTDCHNASVQRNNERPAPALYGSR
jgi:hypothetical protein